MNIPPRIAKLSLTEVTAALRDQIECIRLAGFPEHARKLATIGFTDPYQALAMATANTAAAPKPEDVTPAQGAIELLSLDQIREILNSGKVTDPTKKWELAARARELRGDSFAFKAA